MSQRPASARRTYGHSRAEILAALANGVGLAVIAIVIMIGAIERFGSPAEINGLGVVAFACGALLYELISLWLLNAGRAHNLNVRGAWLHIMSDAFGSLGAIASGLAIWAYGWYWADSAASLLISALVLHSAWRLIRDAVDVLMETAPAHLEVDQIRADLAGLPTVGSVHDLHVWTIGSGEVSLSCHLVTDSRTEVDDHKLLNLARDLLRDRFEILHTTVQVERPSPEAGDGADAGLDCEGACDAAEDPA
jgi:cobalt-zinc-cadmium efflux system protein